MTRYLTPSKIGLLVLVQLYCDSRLPNSAVVPVLSFALSHLLPSPKSSSSHGPGTRSLTIEDFEKLTKVHPSRHPGRTLFDDFVTHLWSYDCLNAFHLFFERLNGYVSSREALQTKPASQILLSKTSPLGIFFRRAHLEFTRLQFDDTAKLWMAFLKFRESTDHILRRRNNVLADMPFDSALSAFDVRNPERLALACYGVANASELSDTALSVEDFERILEYDLEKLQRFGSRVPKAMQDQIKGIMQSPAKTPHVAYFVSFFDAWRGGDFIGAFENLHRYFDYTVRARNKSFYQYALLHMAILYADFGCFAEALAAMNETIATARENQDVTCLNFSITWLSHLSKAYPVQMKRAGHAGLLGSEKDRLGVMTEKAKENKNWSLLSSLLLSEAKLALTNGGYPSQANEFLYQCAHLNFSHQIFSNCGTQLLVESAMYARTGINLLAENDCEIILDCYVDKSPVEEIVRATCRRAQSATQSGQYGRGKSLLEGLNPEILRTLRLSQYVVTYSGVMKLKHALRRYDLVGAEHMLHQLKAGGWSDPDLDFQLASLEVDYLIRQKSTAAAADKLEQKLDGAAGIDTDVVHQVMLLLSKAEIFSRAGKAGKGFSTVLRAASIAWRCQLMPLLWEAIGALANILNFFEEFEHAARILDAVLPQALGASDNVVSAQLYSRQADAHMGLTGATEAGSRQRLSLLSKTEGFVDRALVLYQKLQDLRGQCDMLAKKAVIAKMRGDVKLADDWASKYMTLYQGQVARQGLGGEGEIVY